MELYIPTDEDLHKLARDTPALHQALALYRAGHCSLDDALRLTVAALAAQLKHAQNELVDAISRATPPIVIVKKQGE